MTRAQHIAVGTWFENHGLWSCKIELVFNVFKISIIYVLMSMPFMFSFKGDGHDLEEDLIYDPSNSIYYIYLTITYLILSCAIVNNDFERIKKIVKCEKMFQMNGLDINDTRNQTLDDVLERLSMDKQTFLQHNLQIENFLIAFEDLKYLDTKMPYFTSMLDTLPLEIALKGTLSWFYLNEGFERNFSRTSDNTDKFKEFSRKMGWTVIPFLPVLLIFTLANHTLTYSSNGQMLSTHSYTRHGRWKLRYYNEFESNLKSRLRKTHGVAESVISTYFIKSWKSTLFRFISFVSGSMTSIGLYMSFRGYERMFGMDIIPIIGILASLSAMTFPQMKTNQHGLQYLKNMLKQNLTIHELNDIFCNKFMILLKELLSILFLPYYLGSLLPSNSFIFANFFSTYTDCDGYCKYAQPSFRDQTQKTRQSHSVVINGMESSSILVSL